MAKKKEEVKTEMNVSKIINIVAWIISVCLVLYFVTAIFITKEINFKKKEIDETVNIQYNEILAGEILNRSDDEYYVMVYDFKEDTRGIVSGSVYNFALENKVYTVDTSNALNLYLVGDAKLEVIDVSELRVNDTTLLKVKAGNIVESVVGYLDIVEYFNK